MPVPLRVFAALMLLLGACGQTRTNPSLPPGTLVDTGPSAEDAQPPDTGEGPSDSGQTEDAGVESDASQPDTGELADTGFVDMGAPDLGTPDAGMASSDAGSVDAGSFEPPAARDLALWLDADDEATTLSAPGPLGLWRDKSAQGWLFTAPVGREPQLALDTNTNRNVVVFNGRTTWLNAPAFDGLRGEYTIFAVAHARGRNQTMLSGNEAGLHGLLLESTGSNGLRFLHRMPFRASSTSLGEDLRTTDGVLTPNSFQVLIARRGNGSHEVRINGTRFAIPITRPSFSMNIHFTLGRLDASASARYLDGRIAEVLVYRERLDDADMMAIDNYLRTKWGI